MYVRSWPVKPYRSTTLSRAWLRLYFRDVYRKLRFEMGVCDGCESWDLHGVESSRCLRALVTAKETARKRENIPRQISTSRQDFGRRIDGIALLSRVWQFYSNGFAGKRSLRFESRRVLGIVWGQRWRVSDLISNILTVSGAWRSGRMVRSGGVYSRGGSAMLAREGNETVGR